MGAGPCFRLSTKVSDSHGSSAKYESTDKSVQEGERVVHVSIIFRHGARGPGKSEIKPFVSTAVESQWLPEEMEALTTTGHAQMRALGKWFGSEYLQGSPSTPQLLASMLMYNHREIEQGKNDENMPISVPVAWGSSCVQRTVESGKLFFDGMKGAFNDMMDQKRQVKVRRIDYGSDTAADDRFKAWSGTTFRQAFEDQVANIRGAIGQAFVSKARENKDTLLGLSTRHGQQIELLTNDDDDDANNVLLVKLLRHMCYFHCMLEVERFWPAAKKYSNSAIVAEENCDDTETCAKKGCLILSLSSTEVDNVEELARWVWQNRFHTSGWGAVIGGRLLCDLVLNMATSLRIELEDSLLAALSGGGGGGAGAGGKGSRPLEPSSECIGIFSGHDYTILSLLTALGIRSYDHVLGFGAFLLFEVVATTQSLVTNDPSAFSVRVRLNATPFPEPSFSDSVTDKTIVLLEMPFIDLLEQTKRITEEAASLTANFKAKASFAAAH